MAKNIASKNIFAGLQDAPEVMSHPTHAAAPVAEPKEHKEPKESKKTVHSQEGAALRVQLRERSENRTARMQFVVTPSLKKRVARVAQRAGVSVNELVNQLLDQYCTGMEQEK